MNHKASHSDLTPLNPLPDGTGTFSGQIGARASGLLSAEVDALAYEYQQLVRYAALQARWTVLNVHGGNGPLLPTLSRLVGRNGHVVLTDPDPMAVVAAEMLIASLGVQTRFTVDQANATQLEYAPNTFDAAILSNPVRLREELAVTRLLHELRRVVRPGGTVALTASDALGWMFGPEEPAFVWRLLGSAHPALHPYLRTTRYHELFWASGLVDVRCRTILAERRAPLHPTVQAYVKHTLAAWCEIARVVGVDKIDQTRWDNLARAERAEHIMHQPDFFWRVPLVVVVGRVP